MTKTQTRLVAVVAALAAALATGVVLTPKKNKIDKNRVYRIGYASSPPLHFQDKAGKAAGLAVGIVREAARRRGIRLEWKQAKLQGIPALRQGETDFWVLMTDLPERHAVIHLTEPYLVTEYCFLVPSEGPFQTFADLAEARIAFPNTEVGLKRLTQLLPRATPLPSGTPRLGVGGDDGRAGAGGVSGPVQRGGSAVAGRVDAAGEDHHGAAAAELSGFSVEFGDGRGGGRDSG